MGKNHPPHIQKAHWDEWTTGSAVDPELTALNLESISIDEPYHRLLYDWDTKRKHIDAKWRRIHRSFGKNWTHGGWWCYGGENTIWGCFKPDRPRFDPNKSKPIKYEHPASASTEAFLLKVPRHLWQRISSRYEVAIGDYLDFWQWVKDHPQIPIVIAEGIKKAAALLSQGYVAVAVPGVWSGVRTPKNKYNEKIGKTDLIPELAEFAQRDRSFIMAFDQDVKQSTRRKVNKAIAKTGLLLKSSGCQVKVASWDARFKGVDDLIVGCGSEALDHAIESAQDLEIWQAHQLNQLTYPPDLTLNSRYLGSFSPPADAQLIGLKSPKGTGKTFWLGKQVEPIIRNGGKKVLLLVHRIQLGSELCLRLGISYIDEERGDDFGLWGFGLCVDSLHPNSKAKINPEDFKGCDLIIDESEQVFWHLLNSPTCISDRVSILKTLEEIVKTVLSTGGKIYLSDADLSDLSIDYIKSLAGFKVNQWIAVNEWKPETGWDVYSYGGSSPDQLVSDLIEHIRNGGKPFICTGGQKITSGYGTQNLESLITNKFPHLKVLRIDSESVADPNHPAYGCIERLNEIFPLYDVVIASPTLETGVSIECQHFTSVWGILSGHQPINSACQFLARVRANIPRYIWAKNTGFGYVGSGSINIKSILATQHKAAKANISLLTQADFTDDIDSNFQPESLRTWAKLSARINLGMKAYRASIEAKLQDEGHNIIDNVPSDDDDELREKIEATSDEVKATKEGNYQNYCSAIATAPDIDDKAFLKLKDQRAKTKQEREQYRKAELNNRYGVEVDSDLVKKDDDGWYRLLRLHYFYSIGREHLQARDKASAQRMLEGGDGSIFKPDFNQKQLGAKIATLDLIGFDKLLRQREFPQNDSEVLAIAQFCKRHSYEIHVLLGIRIKDSDSPIAIAQKLLSLIGYRLPRLRREGSRDDRQLIYGAAAPDFQKDYRGKLLKDDTGQAIPIPDGRDEVFASWLERDAAREVERQAIRETESVSLKSQYSITPHQPSDTNRVKQTPDPQTIPTGEPSQGGELSGMIPLPRINSFGQLWRAIGESAKDLDNRGVRCLAGFLRLCTKEGKHLFDVLRWSFSGETIWQAMGLLECEEQAIIRRWESRLC